MKNHLLFAVFHLLGAGSIAYCGALQCRTPCPTSFLDLLASQVYNTQEGSVVKALVPQVFAIEAINTCSLLITEDDGIVSVTIEGVDPFLTLQSHPISTSSGGQKHPSQMIRLKTLLSASFTPPSGPSFISMCQFAAGETQNPGPDTEWVQRVLNVVPSSVYDPFRLSFSRYLSQGEFWAHVQESLDHAQALQNEAMELPNIPTQVVLPPDEPVSFWAQKAANTFASYLRGQASIGKTPAELASFFNLNIEEVHAILGLANPPSTDPFSPPDRTLPQ